MPHHPGAGEGAFGVLSADYLEDEHAVVGGDGPSTLGDYGGTGNLLIITDLLHRIDDVVRVLLQRIVGAGRGSGVRAVVVHREAAAHIQILDIGHLSRFGINPRRLVHCVLDRPDVGDLRADMEVEHLQAASKPSLLEDSHQFQGLAGREAELGRLPTRLHPPAGAAGKELHPHPDSWHHAHGIGVLQDVVDLLEKVYHYDYIVQIVNAQGEAEIILILVAIADQGSISWQAQRESGQ